MKSKFINAIFFYFLTVSPIIVFAQANIGMASGNYAGITGLWANPASIADSRYKFDINIIGYDSYFENNYLLVKKDAFLRRIFYKDPYKSSYTDAKNDLLEEQWPLKGNVSAAVQSNILLPLSFMATTGEKSAIAFSMNNRSVNTVRNMNPELARMFFNALNDPSLYGKDINIDTMQYNFINWQEIGFTYSRVLLEDNHQQLKMGFTGKWLGVNAAGYIQTDQATVNFADSVTLSLNSDLIHYARTETADIDQFKRRDLFNNLEDQAFGWDVGFIYEFRARVKKFKYVDEEMVERKRRDLNKYTFRFGISLVDMGKFKLNKKPLTNDHSANINNWNFSDVHASNFTDWDSAYSEQVQYKQEVPSTFTYRLPSAMIGNFDLHLFGGFYVNAAAQVHLQDFGKPTDTYLKANRWTVITPRYEGKSFGLYVPVNRSNKRTNVGATIRIGPFYFGSNNALEILSNSKTQEADFHFGFRFSVPYGKPTRMNAFLASLVNSLPDSVQQDDYYLKVDSLQMKVAELEKNLNDSAFKKGINIYVQNYGVESLITGQTADSLSMQNSPSDKFIQQQDSINRNIDLQTDTLLYALAAKNLENEQLNKELEKTKGGKKRETQKIETNNKALTKEVSRMRKQMAIQNATLITAVALANKDDKGDKKDTVYAVTTVRDTIRISDTTTVDGKTVIRDTIVIRDTVVIKEPGSLNAANVPFSTDTTLKFEPVTFPSGSYAVSATDRKRLETLANQAKTNPGMMLEVTAINDATGSVTANRKIANARLSAVSGILIKNGVKDSQLLTRTQLANDASNQNAKSPRRVEIRVLKLN